MLKYIDDELCPVVLQVFLIQLMRCLFAASALEIFSMKKNYCCHPLCPLRELPGKPARIHSSPYSVTPGSKLFEYLQDEFPRIKWLELDMGHGLNNFRVHVACKQRILSRRPPASAASIAG